MPAGSVVVFLGTLWHRGGANRSDRSRLAITPQYCEPWARQQEQMVLSVGAAAARFSDRGSRRCSATASTRRSWATSTACTRCACSIPSYDPATTGARHAAAALLERPSGPFDVEA